VNSDKVVNGYKWGEYIIQYTQLTFGENLHLRMLFKKIDIVEFFIIIILVKRKGLDGI